MLSELSECHKSIDNEKNDFYKTMYIHKVSFPKDLYENCTKWFYSFQKQDNANEEYDFGFWDWGTQVFIPVQFLNKIQVISVKEMNYSDFLNKYKNIDLRKQQYPTEMYGKKLKQ